MELSLPVLFTDEQKPVGYLVKQEFAENGPGTFHYLEGRSQYNGSARIVQPATITDCKDIKPETNACQR